MIMEDDLKSKETVGYTRGIVRDCAKLNVRAQPSMDSEVLCTIDRGAKIAIKHGEPNEDWYEVISGGKTRGYCMKEFIKDTGSVLRGL